MTEKEVKDVPKADKKDEIKESPKVKGKLVCVFTIRGEDKAFKPGDVYDGKNAKYLLKKGAIKKV
ncbi:MAG: hypothetical protein ACUZ8H_09365 [Candidatus Anammoxibacter sp.]